MKTSVVVALLSCVLWLSDSRISVASPTLSEIEQEVRIRGESFLEALLGMNADKLLAHFDRDTKMIINGRTYASYDVIEEHWRNTFSRWTGATGGWDDVEVRVLGPDAAIFHGNFHAAINRPTGEITTYPVIPYTILFERREENWLVTLIHESIDPGTVKRDAASASSGQRSQG